MSSISEEDQSPMASLLDDLVVEILSRLPVKSLCRCKAVSRRWRSLIAHKDLHRKFWRTLPGLLYCSSDPKRFPCKARHFTHVWEPHRLPLVHPSLSFLPRYGRIEVLDCCNGMLLCRFSESSLHDAFRYVVCNPVEKSFTVLPDSGCGAIQYVVRLVVVPHLSPEIHVLEFLDEEGEVFGANVYSNVTGAWSYKECGWGPGNYLPIDATSVFYNGFLHLFTDSRELLVVDVKGGIWRTISLPKDTNFSDNCTTGVICRYKDHLCYIGEVKNTDEVESTESDEVENTRDLSIWILEDYEKGDWAKMHQVSIKLLCDKQMSQRKSYCCDLIGILQDCILYFAGSTLMAYDIDQEEVHAVQKLKQRCIFSPVFLYVPFYSE